MSLTFGLNCTLLFSGVHSFILFFCLLPGLLGIRQIRDVHGVYSDLSHKSEHRSIPPVLLWWDLMGSVLTVTQELNWCLAVRAVACLEEGAGLIDIFRDNLPSYPVISYCIYRVIYCIAPTECYSMIIIITKLGLYILTIKMEIQY